VLHTVATGRPRQAVGSMTVTDASLAATRDSYDALAAEHPDKVSADLGSRPLDRALLAAFAELVQAGGNRPVADVGCGAGRVTILLSRLGLDAFGVDLSPGMVALARRTYPQLRFAEGSMLALDVPAATLGGLLAYYSIIHIERGRRQEAFAEFHRVLAPGGVLMLVFQIGDEQGHRTEFFGTPVSVDWYRQRPDDIADLLRETGFEMWTTAVREPASDEKTAQGYVLARKTPAKSA
jgi:SAM-dependent methyltransferase